MIKFGKMCDKNLVEAKKRTTRAWQNRHNLAKPSDKQFGKSYDSNFVNNIYLPGHGACLRWKCRLKAYKFVGIAQNPTPFI